MKVLFNRSQIAVVVGLGIAVLAAGIAGAGPNHAAKESKPSAATIRKTKESLASVGAFQSWAESYAAMQGAKGKSALHAQGRALLQQRRQALAELVKLNPELALKQALPVALRSKLPAELAAGLEERVSGTGDLSVLIYCPGPNGVIRPMERRVTLNGKTYPAYVYGRREAQTTKHGIPLSGILVDGVLALDESPIRELETGEAATDAVWAAGAGRHAAQTEIVAEVGGQRYRFNSRAHLEATKAELDAAEAGLGPQPKKSHRNILAGDSVTAAAGGTAGNGANPPTAWTTGAKKILVIRVDFSDLTGDPVYPGIVGTAAYMDGLANGPVADYYVNSSYGQTTITNIVTTQLYRLPQTSTTYSASFDVDTLHADARSLASADYNLADYDRICVVFSFIPDFGFGGLAELGGPNLWVNGEFDFRVYAHELGHTYGLMHAGLWEVTDGNPISPSGSVVEYGDDFDTMGANFANDLRTDFNPYFKNILGWLRDDQVATATTAPATYRLHTFDFSNSFAATNAPLLALKVVKDGTKSYWVGIRHNFTDNPFMENGAYVIWGYNQGGAGGGGGYQSALLDMVSPGNSLFDSPLPIGATFNDAGIGIAIQPAVAGGIAPDSYVDIFINGGEPVTPEARFVIVTNYVSGGNGNGVIDYNECNNLDLVITNGGNADATQVQVTVSTATPGVSIGTRTVPFPDLPTGAGATNLVPITISTAPFFVCGTPITLAVLIKSDQVTTTNVLVLPTGSLGTPVRFDSTGAVAIPDLNSAGTNSVITVSGIASAVNKVTVSMYLPHTFVSDLYFELVGPDGTTVMLSDHNGGSGNNFGVNCEPENFRTTFDDDASLLVTGGGAPFVGSFKPEESLAAFVGKVGTNVNGNWTLHVVDDVGFDIGTVECWSLFISSAACDDGGGTCPGADLRIGLSDAPDPVFIGSNLVYTINVTNFGPSEAKGTVINHTLPSSVVFVSAFASQGGVSFSGGTLVANVGNLPIAGRATVTVNVIPTLAGNITSSATASSNEPDPDTANNTATTSTQVNPPASDITVGLLDAPDPVLVGGTLTYTVSVTNKGPSTASNVTVTNTLPVSVAIHSATPSQGAVFISGNLVIFNFGSLTNGGRASATISVTPTAAGNITATAVARASQIDPVLANNTSSATTVVGPAADLVLTLTDLPDPVVLGSNWVYTTTVTNQGPSSANNVVINQTLPAGVSVVSASATTGTPVVTGNAIATAISSLASGAGTVITVTANSTNLGTAISSATVTAAEADPNPTDNSASVSTVVATPFVSIVAAGSTLTAESLLPADGAISPGETVTLQLRLRNAGNVSSTPVTATLLATNGITAPSGTALSYGVLAASGVSAFQTFSFTATGTNGGTIAATLQVFTNGVFHTNVAFSFTLPTVRTFANTNPIVIGANGVPALPASPYPSTIAVSGVNGLVGKVTVTVSNLSHSYPDDIDMLLVSPEGQKTILMSDAGGQPGNPAGVSGITVTFDDAGAQIPDEGPLLTGSYHPTDYESGDAFNSPAPAGAYVASLSTFAGANANGTWALYIMDDGSGDSGAISNGWSMAFTLITPVNQVADLGLVATATPSSGLIGNSITTTFTVTNAGPNAAAGVTLTNLVPAGASLVSAIASQGAISTNGNVAIASLGNLNVGATATLTVVVLPGLGSLTNATTGVVISPASVGTTDTDLNSANNTAAAVALVHLPVANLALTQTTATNYVTLSSNVTFAVTVTNLGPQSALDVVVTDPLPAGFNFVSTSAGSFTNALNNLTVHLGNLAAGESSSFTITATATTAGFRTNLATVATSSSDTNLANNSVALALVVVAPSPSIVAAGQLITAESLTSNGAVDLGETVTVSFSLQNVGTAPTTNLRATLQPSGGVAAPSAAQSYGALALGGSASRTFSFTAPNLSGGAVVATLALKDETPSATNDLGTVVFVFNLPGTVSFTNAAAITILPSGPATLYPSTISVSGVTGVVNQVSVRLNGFAHAFPDDVDVLLVSPSGHKVLLLSDAGGGHSVTNLNLTLADGNSALPDSAALTTGSFSPTDYGTGGDAFPAPAPAGTPALALAAFKGGTPNGDWSLYVVDDSTGDAGAITGGWTLTLTTLSVVNPLADLVISVSAAPDAGAPNPPFVGSALIYTISVTNNGPDAATGVSVSDTLPAGLSYVSSSVSQGSVATGGSVTWTIGNLAVGGSAVATIRTATTTGGSVANTASVSGSQIDLSAANNIATATTTVRLPVRATFSNLVVTNGQLQFTLTGDVGLSYRISASTNLTTWTAISTNAVGANGSIKFTDSAAPAYSRRFYRAERLVP